jgi:hypothetical protein
VRNLACLAKRTACLLDAYGLLAEVTFMRIDEAQSAAPHALYRERRTNQKVYRTFLLKALVDENPRQNPKGATGAEVTEDVYFTFYDTVAAGGTETGQTYAPKESDSISYRGVTYDMTRIERINPNGVDSQTGYRVMGKRHR